MFQAHRSLDNAIDAFLESSDKADIVLCGAGFALPHIFRKLSTSGFNVVAIVDRDVRHHGKLAFGCCLIGSLEYAARTYPEATYVISSPLNFWEILNELESHKPRLDVCRLDLDCSHYFSGREFKRFVFANQDRFSAIHDRLADTISKETWLRVIRAHITGERRDFEDACSGMDDWYLFNGLFRPSQDCVYVDCGSFDGDTIFRFVNAAKDGYREIFALEPDHDCYASLVRNLQEHNVARITTLKKAAYDTTGTLRFYSEGMYSFIEGGNSSTTVQAATIEIETDTIDFMLADKHVELIKMDIEGSETRALEGARETIARCQPNLAICLYHNIEDFVRIPEQVLEMNPNYRLFIRHQSRGCTDTILFAKIL